MIKYFKKFAIRTGYDVFSYLSLVIMIATYVVPYVLYKNNPAFGVMALLALILINIVRNQKLEQFRRVVFVTFIQFALGLIAPIILVIKIFMHITGKSSVIYYEALCWAGERSTDYDRAKKYGYNSVDEAIEAGVLYDGTKLW